MKIAGLLKIFSDLKVFDIAKERGYQFRKIIWMIFWLRHFASLSKNSLQSMVDIENCKSWTNWLIFYKLDYRGRNYQMMTEKPIWNGIWHSVEPKSFLKDSYLTFNVNIWSWSNWSFRKRKFLEKNLANFYFIS